MASTLLQAKATFLDNVVYTAIYLVVFALVVTLTIITIYLLTRNKK